MRAVTFSGHSNLVGQEYFEPLYCSGKTSIHSSNISTLYASGSTDISSSTAKKLKCSGVLKAADCPKLGAITASGKTAITHCKDITEITASGKFSLESSKVNGDVIFSGDDPAISDSTIGGKLECAAKIVKISNSAIGKIVVKPIRISSEFEFFFWKWKTIAHTEQVIELSGKNCQIGSISFEDGAVGKVVLKNGATMPVNENQVVA